ncbi:MAG: GNAT family N-acetyltransferase [Bacteroidota bacterium]
MSATLAIPSNAIRRATIRPVLENDLEAIVVLCADHAAYEGAPYDPAGKAEALHPLLFGPSASLHGLVAAVAGLVLGYATWSVQVSTWDARCYAHMDCLYLRPEARGEGIGRRLAAHLVRDVQAAGLRQVQWQTPSHNTRAMRFYDRLGATGAEKVRFTLRDSAFPALLS